MTNKIDIHYKRQHDVSQGGANPEFVIGIGVYLNELVDVDGMPKGSVAVEFGPIASLGEKRAQNPHPSNVEIFATVHQVMTSLMQDPEVAAYAKNLARLVKAEDRSASLNGLISTPMQRARAAGEMNAAIDQAVLERLRNKLS